MPQTQMAQIAAVANAGIIVDWCHFCHEEYKKWLEEHCDEIGGMDGNGDSTIVDIDKSEYFHRKYHRGR